LEKHRKAMAKETTACSRVFLDGFIPRMLQIVSKMTFSDLATTHEYSTNACYENGRAAGGAKYHMMRSHVSDGDTGSDELLRMEFCPYKGVTERRGYLTQDFTRLLSSAKDKVCEAKVYSVCEPLKIRNITAGNAVPYALAKGMQKSMHSSLKAFPQFRLIGEPLTEDIVKDFLVKRKWGEKIASGDFSAATDNVKIELTKLCFEAILNKVLSEGLYPKWWSIFDYTKYRAILRRVLYEHLIEYPNSDIDPVMQVNGQLMGSNLSFPILCIINLVTYWLSVEPQVQDFRKLNVLVNGDDIMFCCDQVRYSTWLSTLHEAGLTPSPGKNFFHEKYGTVNSALFYLRRDGSGGSRCIYLPFFNSGMLLGQSKVARESEGKNKPIHCLHQCAMHGAHNKIRADSRFRYYNKDALSKCSTMYDGTVLNWYLPATMGGLGMKLQPGMTFSERHSTSSTEVYVTKRQRALAYGLREQWYREDLTRAPFKAIGMEVDDDKEGWGDIRKNVFLQAQLASCPMLPTSEPIPEDRHTANWYLPVTGGIEGEILKYQFRGLDYRRFAKSTEVRTVKDCTLRDARLKARARDILVEKQGMRLLEYPMLRLDNPHLYEEIKLYKRRTHRIAVREEFPGLTSLTDARERRHEREQIQSDFLRPWMGNTIKDLQKIFQPDFMFLPSYGYLCTPDDVRWKKDVGVEEPWAKGMGIQLHKEFSCKYLYHEITHCKQ
jgi:hypothetical protein